MRLHNKIAAVLTTAAAVAMIGTGTAQAQDNGSLLSLLNEDAIPLLDSPSVVLACFPVGQAGANNHFTGTQQVNCSQSATQTNPNSPIGGDEVERRVVTDGPYDFGPNTTGRVTVQCPEGFEPVSGGVDTSSPQDVGTVTSSFPEGNRWTTGMRSGTQGFTATFYAVCESSTS